MSEIKLVCCDDPDDEVIVNSSCKDKFYISTVVMGVEWSCSIDLKSVNKLQQLIVEWKEVNGYE